MIESFLDVARDFGIIRFKEGECHNLAAALYLADNKKGNLIACMRKEVDEFGETITTCYSHMAYVDQNDRVWDIDGETADIRWEAIWPIEPDDDGLVSEFEWDVVPFEELDVWLKKYKVEYNAELTDGLVHAMQTQSIEATLNR